jgi:hypothetical protein
MTKPKNTPQNKESFFGQHVNQDVLHDGVRQDRVKKSWNWRHGDFKLRLKHLKDITDEDILYIFKLLRGDSGEPTIERYDSCVTCICKPDKPSEFDWVTIRFTGSVEYRWDWEDQPIVSALLSLEIYDYLRSQGYVLPWRGLSVDELIEYGWVIL